MLSPLYITFPLAEQNRMDGLFRALRAEKDQNGIFLVLLIFAGIVLVMASVWLVNYFRQRRHGSAGPISLFLSLCREHKLKWSECWLLWRLARLQHLTDPARLFLEPKRFNASRLPAALRPRTAQLKSMHNRLFGELQEGVKLNEEGQPASILPIQPTGAALPTLKSAPNLDIPPWPATNFAPPSPPLTNSSDNAPV